MMQESLLGTLQASEAYFERSTSALTEDHSTFAPGEATSGTRRLARPPTRRS